MSWYFAEKHLSRNVFPQLEISWLCGNIVRWQGEALMAASIRQSPEDLWVSGAIRFARNTKVSTLHLRGVLVGGSGAGVAVAMPRLSAHYVWIGMTKGSSFFCCLIYRSKEEASVFINICQLLKRIKKISQWSWWYKWKVHPYLSLDGTVPTLPKKTGLGTRRAAMHV